MPQPGQRVDPYRNFQFLVHIDGITQASFSECSGVSSTTEVIEYREGGNNSTVFKLPGKTSYGDITLKWGITGDLAFWNWVVAGMNGLVQRTEGSVSLLNENLTHLVVPRRSWQAPHRPTGPCIRPHQRCQSEATAHQRRCDQRTSARPSSQ